MKSSQRCRISLLFALIVISAVTCTSAQDIIIYDDQLNPSWENWSWDVTLDFSHSNIVNNGAHALSVTFDKAWAALSLHTSQPYLIQNYSELRFWIHSGSQSGQMVDILLIDENGNEAPQRYKIPSLPGEGWHEYHISLTSFGTANAITGFYWHDNSGQPQPTFYLDDITLVSQPSVVPTPTPIPPEPAYDVIIYDDQLDASWENWSWDVTFNASNTQNVKNGIYAISARYDKAWAGLYLHSKQPYNPLNFSELRFWIHGGAQGGQIIDVIMLDQNEQGAPKRFSIPTLPSGVWQEYRIPISSFGTINSLAGFYWHDNSGQPQTTFYLDDITLVSSSDLKPTPTPVPTLIPHDPSIQTKWDLWNSQTHLRGANIYQRHVHPNVDGPTFFGPGPIGPPFTQSDFDRLAGMGANYVNISCSGIYTEKPPYQVDLDVQQELDDLLAMIEKADMFAVICFRSGPGRSEFALYYGDWLPNSFRNDSVWNDSAAQDAWVDMWRYTTERYANNPIVVGFDLMVEPNSNEMGYDSFNPLDIWDPNTFFNKYGGSLLDFGPLSTRIASEIRRGNTQIPILIAGNGYSAVNWLPYVQLVNEPHIVYTCHQYAPHMYTGADWSQSNFNDYTYPGLFDLDYDNQKEQFNKTWLEKELKPISTFKQQHRVPVAINEYGVKRWVQNGHTFMDDQMEMFENLQVNYALWEWVPDWPNFNSIDDYNFRHGPDPGKHADLKSSDRIDTIKKYWSKNVHRPSTVQFKSSTIQWYKYE